MRKTKYTVENSNIDTIGISEDGEIGCFRWGAIKPIFEKREHAEAFIEFLEKLGINTGDMSVVDW